MCLQFATRWLRCPLFSLLLCNILPAMAQTDPSTSGDPATTLDTISVTGRGESRQVQRVLAEDMKAMPPGSTPFNLLTTKPGVHFEAGDASGTYE